MTRITNAERTRLFGKPCTSANHRLYVTPWGIRVQVHKLIASRFAAACVVAHRESRWRPQRIDGYNCRTVRGSDSYSIHAWAMAWDFFATPPNVPPPGGVWTPDNPPDAKFVAAFVSLNFVWGGTFGRKDTPHIEWASGLPGAEPNPRPPQEVVKPMFGPFDIRGAVASAKDRETGGVWLLGSDGAIFAFEGARGVQGVNGQGFFAGRQAARIDRDAQGFAVAPPGKILTIIATSGERYHLPW